MRLHSFHFLSAAFSLAVLLMPVTAQGQIRSYDVNFATTGPTIDGTITAGEWDAAASGGGDWTLLGTPEGGDPDVENNRFQALWNQDGFYLLAESDYDAWGIDARGQNPAVSDFAGDFLTVVFDPNTTADENSGQLDTEVDNYQFSFNLYGGGEKGDDPRTCGGDGVAGTADDCTQPTDPPLGATSTSVTGSTFGTLTAAHAGRVFENDAEWGHLRRTHISYDISDADGAVIEMFVPWDEFDALATTNNEAEKETGLHHPFAPSTDDVWFFNVARQSTAPENTFPQWNWTSSALFVSHGNGAAGEGHGELTFVGGPTASFLPADFDESGTVDFADFLILSGEFGNSVDPAGSDPDLDGSGIVDFADFLTLSGTFGQSAAAVAPVPEPTALSLFMFAGMLSGFTRRKRNAK